MNPQHAPGGRPAALLFISFAAVPRNPDVAVARQRQSGMRRADERELRVVHEIVEMGASARSFKNRVAFHWLINYFEDHPDVHHVIFPGVHRVSRSRKEFNTILQLFQEMGITIVTFAGNVVSGDEPSGVLVERVAQYMTEYSDQQRRRYQKALRDKRATTGGAA